MQNAIFTAVIPLSGYHPNFLVLGWCWRPLVLQCMRIATALVSGWVPYDTFSSPGVTAATVGHWDLRVSWSAGKINTQIKGWQDTGLRSLRIIQRDQVGPRDNYVTGPSFLKSSHFPELLDCTATQCCNSPHPNQPTLSSGLPTSSMWGHPVRTAMILCYKPQKQQRRQIYIYEKELAFNELNPFSNLTRLLHIPDRETISCGFRVFWGFSWLPN